MKSLIFILSLVSTSPAVFAGSISEQAVSNSNRTGEEKKADEHRHPRELLDFSKAKPGDTVIDFFPGRGYFTRLFSNLVGPKGHVIAFVPKEVEGAKFKPVEAAKKGAEGLKNVEVKVQPLGTEVAKNVDVIWTSDNYHDVHIKSFMNADVVAFNKSLFAMLKPGGHLIVVDHVAAAGSSEADVEKLHRIDPKVVMKEVLAAGFVLEEESKVLAQSETHTLNVFDPGIRGKTDQFAFRFVKPLK